MLITIILGLALIASAAGVYAVSVRSQRGKSPRPLNYATNAREARPFSNKPDERFAPIPLEREEHQK